MIERIKAWVQASEEKQANSPKWKMPVITSQDIKNYMKEVNDKAKQVMNKPVPKKEEPKKEEPAPANDTKMDEEKPNTSEGTKMDEEK